MLFFLGTHEPSWLRDSTVELFVSRRRLARLRSLPVASTGWALDSGGFTELRLHGGWTVSVDQYVDDVGRYASEIGNLRWAAPQDWMVEPFMVERTGLSVAAHQELTVSNFLELRRQLSALVVPVLQGWTLQEYQRCWDLYGAAGVDLAAEPLVGLGSVCRREATADIGTIVSAMAQRGARCHGFGVKARGIARYGHLLASADSMAWSYAGRWRGTCARRSRCANCRHYALAWREQVTDAVDGPHQTGAVGGPMKSVSRRK